MSTTLVAPSPAPFTPVPRTPSIRRIGLIGAGDVVRGRYWPALATVSPALTGVLVCSREPQSPLAGIPHSYLHVAGDGVLPLGEIDARGFLSRETLWIIAASTDCHAPCALQLAPHAPVAIEKPIAATAEQARALLPLARRGLAVYPIDHKLFSADFLAFLDQCRALPEFLARVRHIEG